MKKVLFLGGVCLYLALANLTAWAADGQGGPVEKFAGRQIDKMKAGCQSELDTYCQNVIPGEGRLAACIYAHSNKLSQRCVSALYDSFEELENAVVNLAGFVKACRVDVKQFCPDVVVGEGRMLACLQQNQKKISAPCSEVLKKANGDLGQKGMVR